LFERFQQEILRAHGYKAIFLLHIKNFNAVTINPNFELPRLNLAMTCRFRLQINVSDMALAMEHGDEFILYAKVGLVILFPCF
jgi:hypothetical protein